MRDIKTENRKSALQAFRRAGKKLMADTSDNGHLEMLALLDSHGKIVVMADYQCGQWCGDIEITTPSRYKFLPWHHSKQLQLQYVCET